MLLVVLLYARVSGVNSRTSECDTCVVSCDTCGQRVFGVLSYGSVLCVMLEQIVTCVFFAVNWCSVTRITDLLLCVSE